MNSMYSPAGKTKQKLSAIVVGMWQFDHPDPATFIQLNEIFGSTALLVINGTGHFDMIAIGSTVEIGWQIKDKALETFAIYGKNGHRFNVVLDGRPAIDSWDKYCNFNNRKITLWERHRSHPYEEVPVTE